MDPLRRLLTALGGGPSATPSLADRRGFLRLAGLATAAAVTAPQLEKIAAAAGIPVPDALLEQLPRPLQLSFSDVKFRGVSIAPDQYTPGYLNLNEIDAVLRKQIMSDMMDNIYKNSPLLQFLQRDRDLSNPSIYYYQSSKTSPVVEPGDLALMDGKIMGVAVAPIRPGDSGFLCHTCPPGQWANQGEEELK